MTEKPKETNGRRTTREKILNVLGVLLVVLFLFWAFAPDDFFHSGVAPVEKRTASADFTLQKPGNAGAWNFGAQRGRVVLVNYWATWCFPCREEMPALVRLAEEYKSRGVEIVGVTMDEDLSEVAPFVAEFQISYSILLPGGDPNSSIVEGVPTSALYDKRGRLAKIYRGKVSESTLRADFERLLAER